MIFLPVERKTIKDDCECKQDTWSAVFINQAHFAIPPTGVQLKDAAPGIKMGCCGKLCLLCQQQQILNKHFANHCNIGNTKKQDMLSMLRFYMRLWPNKEGGVPVCVLVSSQSRSTSEGALGREYNEVGCSSGHSIATLLIFIHPKGIHSSGRYNYNRVMDMTIST